MTRYELPKGMEYATLEQRESFYKNEFNVQGVVNWLKDYKEVVLYAMIGRHTNIYPAKYEKFKKTSIRIDKYEKIEDIKNYGLDFLPEGLYYDRNFYKSRQGCKDCKTTGGDECWKCENFMGQEIAFDIDPENIDCPVHGTLSDKMKRHQGLGFCMYEFNQAKEMTGKLYDLLKERFSDPRIVYSGRGLHVHVMDKDTFTWPYEDRSKLADEMYNAGIKHDRWVARGGSKLIRLPYSLHGMVSRVVTPLDRNTLDSFNPVESIEVLPSFMKK